MVLTDAGLQARGWLGVGKLLLWEKVRKLEWIAGLGYRLHGKGKAVVDVSFLLKGMKEFEQACRQCLDEAVIGSAFEQNRVNR